jgi:hypothetical protein
MKGAKCIDSFTVELVATTTTTTITARKVQICKKANLYFICCRCYRKEVDKKRQLRIKLAYR